MSRAAIKQQSLLMPSTPLLVVVGQTATGKTALAIELAKYFNGEIICADSRTVYRDLTIGTAKPTEREQQSVPHYGLDLVSPAESYTVADFKHYCLEIIKHVSGRGRLPILVGGSGLYIDAVIYDYQFLLPANQNLRSELEQLTVLQLQQRLTQLNIALPFNSKNPRHLIRSIETQGRQPERARLRPQTLIIGLQAEREVLRKRIAQRIETMVAAGLIEEIEQAVRRYGWQAQALQTPGYKAFKDYNAGSIDMAQAKHRFIQNDMNLAKRQRTWFQRNKSIHWLSTNDKTTEAVDIATTFMNKYL